MLEKAGLEEIEMDAEIEKLNEFINTIIDSAGNDLNDEVIDKCHEIKRMISVYDKFKDQPIDKQDELYRRIFSDDPVALNIEK